MKIFYKKAKFYHIYKVFVFIYILRDKMPNVSFRNLIQKYTNKLPSETPKPKISGPLTPVLIVPLSRSTRIGIYTPLIFFPMCLPAILTNATSAWVKIVFAVSAIFVFALCLSYSLHPAITFNRDQLILHHKNSQHLSAIMYEDIIQVALRRSTLMIETSERIYHSVPFSGKYWARMKTIFAEHHVVINLRSAG